MTPQDLVKSGSEQGIQAAVFCWAALPDVRARYPELRWLMAIPNGGFRFKAEAGRLKASGVKRGVPDTMLPVVRLPYYGLWLEFKKPGVGRLSVEQRGWIDYLNSAGYLAVVVDDWELAARRIISYLDGMTFGRLI